VSYDDLSKRAIVSDWRRKYRDAGEHILVRLCFSVKVFPQRAHLNFPGFLRRFSLAVRSFADETVFLGSDDSTVASPGQPETAEDEAATTVSCTGSLPSSSKKLWKVLEADVWLGRKFERK
jgi:hypothetical protein